MGQGDGNAGSRQACASTPTRRTLMQSINFRRCARTVCVLVAGLSAALSGLSFAQSPQTDADRIVAYIDRIIPSDARLADIAEIKGENIERRLKDKDRKSTRLNSSH